MTAIGIEPLSYTLPTLKRYIQAFVERQEQLVLSLAIGGEEHAARSSGGICVVVPSLSQMSDGLWADILWKQCH